MVAPSAACADLSAPITRLCPELDLVEVIRLRPGGGHDLAAEIGTKESERHRDDGRIDERPERILAHHGRPDQGKAYRRDEPEPHASDHATGVEAAPEQRQYEGRKIGAGGNAYRQDHEHRDVH